MDILLIGWWWGKWQSASSTFWLQWVWGLLTVGRKQLTSPTWWGFSICKTAQRYCYVYPLRENQDPAPRLHYCFLTVSPLSPLSLHPLPSLISNCLNLPFGTQEGHGGWMKPISCNQEMGDTERLLCPGAPQGPAWFQKEHRFANALILAQWDTCQTSDIQNCKRIHFCCFKSPSLW